MVTIFTIIINYIFIVPIEISKIEKKIKNKEIKKDEKIALWTKFLLNPNLLEEKEMAENEDIKMAKDKYEEVISDEQEQRRALRREMYFMDMASARAEGKAEGRVEGRAEEKKEVAKKMLKADCDIEMIIECTGLSREEIESLK